LKYVEPTPLSRDAAAVEIASGDPMRVAEALVSLAFFEEDWRWVQEICLAHFSSAEASVRSIAATCIGHVARIHRQLDLQRVVPMLRALMNDPETRGYAEDAWDDITMFVPGAASE
jgi:hypothetical protein